MTFEQAEAFLAERTVGFKKAFVDICGSVTTALLLSQMWYWLSRTSDPEGWFFKTEAEWQKETGLTRRELEGARKRLRDLGFIEEKRREWPAKLFFRVNEKAVLSAVIALFAQNRHTEDPSVCTKPPYRMHKTAIQNARNRHTS